MNIKTKNSATVERKFRTSETVKKVCQDYRVDWGLKRIEIILKFFDYFKNKENKSEGKFEGIEKLNFSNYNFVDDEKKIVCLSVSMTLKQEETIKQMAKDTNTDFSQIVRLPFYFYAKYKKFPWE